jgi:nucleotide-binding universal stress UspA family protein
MFKKILVANDGSEGGKKALAAAISMAKKFEAELHCVSVKERPSHFAETVGEVMEEREETEKFFQRVCSESVNQAREAGLELKCEVRAGHEVETIIRLTRDGHFDLLVVGFMGHSRVFDRIWGGTSQNLTRLAPCSVLLVK